MNVRKSTSMAGPTDPPERMARHLRPALSGVLVSALAFLPACGDRDAGPPAPTLPQPTDPLAIDTPPPDYPLALACAGVGGEVVLVLSLDAKGVPADVRIERSSRQEALDQAAVTAVRGWRFKPATNRGEPVPTKIRVPVKFSKPVMRPDRCFAFDEEQRRSQ